MPRRSRRIATTRSTARSRRERRPNVYTGPAPRAPAGDGDGRPSTASPGEAASTASAAPAARRRRAPRSRRPGSARSRAAVYTEYLPAELKKMGFIVLGTVIALGVLTVFLR